MIGLHNLTLDELRGEIDHQDNEMAKIVFDQAIPEAEEQGREAGIQAVLEHLYPVADLLERLNDIIDDMAETLGGGEMDQLLNIEKLVKTVGLYIKEAEGIE